jgi:hypothetical protein
MPVITGKIDFFISVEFGTFNMRKLVTTQVAAVVSFAPSQLRCIYLL